MSGSIGSTARPADYLFVNAAVYTADPANPHAEAVAVRGKQIVFVGRTADAAAWRGAHTEVIDAGGRSLLPGLIDSHFHLLWGSLKLDKLRLEEADRLEDILAATAAYAAANPAAHLDRRRPTQVHGDPGRRTVGPLDARRHRPRPPRRAHRL